MAPTEVPGTDIRENILCKFQELSTVLGLKKTTVDLLARSCGVSKKTIYQHFRDKNDLIAQATRSKMNLFRGRLLTLSESENHPLAQIELFFELMVTLFGTASEILLFDIKMFYPEIRREIEGLINDVSAMSREHIEKAMALGLFNDIDPRFVVAFMTGAATAVFNTDFYLQHNMTVEQTIHNFKKLALNGLLKPSFAKE